MLYVSELHDIWQRLHIQFRTVILCIIYNKAVSAVVSRSYIATCFGLGDRPEATSYLTYVPQINNDLHNSYTVGYEDSI
jgi:hypothetical protein